MGTLLSLRIQERFDYLTVSEQKLAAVLLDRSDDILTFSATELANVSGVSKATAARLFQSLGYRDFNEVRLQARQERDRTGPTQSVMVPLETVPRGSATISRHLHLEIAGLTRTFEFLRSDRLSEAAEQLAVARRIWVSGLGPDAGMARLAQSLLIKARPGVQLLPEDIETWPAELASMGPGDMLFLVISQRPWPKVLLTLLDFARTAHVRAIFVTDPTSRARVERENGIPLICHAVQAPPAASFTAYCSMITLLHLAVVDRLGSTALVRAGLIEGLQEQIGGD
jgi:DNA-binding MurR/RpiR family transcriptional regulator